VGRERERGDLERVRFRVRPRGSAGGVVDGGIAVVVERLLRVVKLSGLRTRAQVRRRVVYARIGGLVGYSACLLDDV
jgi:hypothetical protein